MRIVSRFLLALAIGAAARPLAAQSAPRVDAPAPRFTVAASNRTAVESAARGAPRRDTTVLPGDVIRYTLTFTNTLSHAVRGLELANPIPAGLHFVEGSASASRDDARAEFSVDGGRTYSARPTETVVIDGRSVQRPVPAERFTNVRWILDGAVASRAGVTAHFDARLGAQPAAASRGQPSVPGKPGNGR